MGAYRLLTWCGDCGGLINYRARMQPQLTERAAALHIMKVIQYCYQHIR